MTIRTISDLINEVLLADINSIELNAYFVHSSIDLKWLEPYFELLTKFDLEIDETVFKMKLFKRKSFVPVHYRSTFLSFSQFSFPWEKDPTIFINSSQFHILEKFIKIHNLQCQISKIDEIPGISSTGELIKIVTFKKHAVVEFRITNEYSIYLHSIKNYQQPTYYYITPAFGWLQPSALGHFNIPTIVNIETLNFMFPIILDHLSTLDSQNTMNINDLIGLRLAFCDPRKPLPTKYIKEKIDYFIGRILKRFIKNKHFDHQQFVFNTNFKVTPPYLAVYLLYEFQIYFETVECPLPKQFIMWGNKSYVNIHIFKLIEQNDAKLVHERSNVLFHIDGTKFDKMSVTLFLNFLACRNVEKITLDSNYPWIKTSHETSKRNIYNPFTFIVVLVGVDIANFLRVLKASIETYTSHNRFRIDFLVFDMPCVLKNYFFLLKSALLKFFNVQKMVFTNIKVETDMLMALTKLKLKLETKLTFDKCHIMSNTTTWRLLQQITHLQQFSIVEDEKTWEGIFEYIYNLLINSGRKLFRFGHVFDILTYTNNEQQKIVELGNINFTINELNSKLELTDLNGIPVDLFYWKNDVQEDPLIFD